MKNLFVLIVLSFLVACNSTSNSPSEEPEVWQGEYSKSIQRISGNEFESNLITSAENYYQPRETVLASLPQDFKSHLPETKYWYIVDFKFGGIFVPIAITIDAIDFYTNVIDSLSAQTKEPTIKVAKLEYVATAEYKESYTFSGNDLLTRKPLDSVDFSNVYVVSMALDWSSGTGSLGGLFFSHKRVVVFDQDGKLLKVFYDGLISYGIS